MLFGSMRNKVPRSVIQAVLQWSHAGINTTTDFLIFMLPLAVLRKLRITPRQKVALYCVFLVTPWSAPPVMPDAGVECWMLILLGAA